MKARKKAGGIIGSYPDANNIPNYFLYTPGSGIAPLPTPTGGFREELSNSGHILTADAAGSYIWTPEGNIRLPAGYVWTGLNARDEVVGGLVFFSQATGLVQLTTAVTGAPGWILDGAVGIADNGTIAALATSPRGQMTGVILVPTNSTETASRDAHEERLRRHTLNGVPVGAPSLGRPPR